jgi:hypothetical protein
VEAPIVKWFKHDANASIDAKLKRLKSKYGMEGYGVYWYLLECIARTVENHNLTFELEEDADLIAEEVNIHRDRIEEMMLFMCNLGLFEHSRGRITCLKMATRSDEYTQKLLRNQKGVRRKSRQAPDKLPPNRREQKRTEEHMLTDVSVIAFDDWYQHYGKKKARGDAEKAWKKLKPEEKQLALERVQSPAFQSWMRSQITETKDYRPYPATWLNARQWTDEDDELTPKPKLTTTWEGPPPCRR